MGLTNFQIVLDSPTGAYYAGTNVIGKLQFTLDKPKKIRGNQELIKKGYDVNYLLATALLLVAQVLTIHTQGLVFVTQDLYIQAPVMVEHLDKIMHALSESCILLLKDKGQIKF